MHLVRFLVAYGAYAPGEVAGFVKEEADKLKRVFVAEDAPKATK